MARLLITATHGYDNSTRASLSFYVAKGAKEAGIEPGIVLALDATVLVKPELRNHVCRRWRSCSSSASTTASRCMSEGVEPRPVGSWTKTSSVCPGRRRTT